MPIYEYVCDGCGAETQERRAMADRDNAPECECGCEMRRKVAAAPALSQTDGFYASETRKLWKARREAMGE
jgi:putative FmdB family regulatory protein